MLESDLINWVEENAALIKWLKHADKEMNYGDIIIHYKGGKIIGYDICPRLREEIKKVKDVDE